MPRTISLLCAGLLVLGAHGAAEAQVPLVPLGDCGWKYIVTGGTVDGIAWSSKTYDDAEWSTGCAPFAKPWACLSGTPIDGEGSLVIRHHVYNPTDHVVNAQYQAWGLGTVAVYINGSTGNAGGLSNSCPITARDNLVAGLFNLDPGDNVIVVRNVVVSFGGGDHSGGQLDVGVTTSDVTAASRATWGAVKAIYR